MDLNGGQDLRQALPPDQREIELQRDGSIPGKTPGGSTESGARLVAGAHIPMIKMRRQGDDDPGAGTGANRGPGGGGIVISADPAVIGIQAELIAGRAGAGAPAEMYEEGDICRSVGGSDLVERMRRVKEIGRDGFVAGHR